MAPAVADVGDPGLGAGLAAPAPPARATTSMPTTSAPLGDQRPADRRADEAAGAGHRDALSREVSARWLACRGHRGPTYTRRALAVGTATPPIQPPSGPSGPAQLAVEAAGQGRRRGGAGGAPSSCRSCASASRSPPAVTTAAVAAGPAGAWRSLQPRNRLRDAGMYALQMWAFFVGHELPYDDAKKLRSRLKDRLPDQDRHGDRRRAAAERPPAAGAGGARPGQRRSTARSPGSTGCGSSSRTPRWSGSSPGTPSASRAPRARCPGVYDLGCAIYYAVADRAALVGVRARPHRRRGAADHGGGRREAVGPRLEPAVRLPRRQPVGRDALAALRRLADGGAAADRGGAGGGRARLGLRGRARASRSSTWASTT